MAYRLYTSRDPEEEAWEEYYRCKFKAEAIQEKNKKATRKIDEAEHEIRVLQAGKMEDKEAKIEEWAKCIGVQVSKQLGYLTEGLATNREIEQATANLNRVRERERERIRESEREMIKEKKRAKSLFGRFKKD
jgi:hypothetical protein